MTLKVLGTSFNVSCYPDETETVATLVSGSVEAETGKTDGQRYILSPEDQLVYDACSGRAEIRRVDADEFMAWTEGGLVINGRSLRDTARLLQKRYCVHIIIATDRYDDERIMVHFRNDETLGNVLHVIQMVIPGMSVSMSDGIVVIG